MKRFVKEYGTFIEDRAKANPDMSRKYVRNVSSEIKRVLKYYECGFVGEIDAMDKISTLASDLPTPVGQPVTFSTGGGVWITAMHGNHDGQYYMITNDCPDCLTSFVDGFDGGEEFPLQDMKWSRNLWELSERQLAIYLELTEHMNMTREV